MLKIMKISNIAIIFLLAIILLATNVDSIPYYFGLIIYTELNSFGSNTGSFIVLKRIMILCPISILFELFILIPIGDSIIKL